MSHPVAEPDERLDAIRRYQYSISPDDTARVPNYVALLHALSESDVAVDILLEVPVEQRNPMLILAILHYCALRGHEQLAPLYRDLGTSLARPPEQFAEDVVAVVQRTPNLLREQLHRTTQTNEVGRSAVLRAVLRALARRGLRDVNLVDVGASAGLNLYLDHYDVSPVPVDDALTLVCDSRTDDDQPGPMPTIHRRIGIDLHPLDLRDEDSALWLRACLWPEDPERLARLERIEELAPTWERIDWLKGSVLDRIDDALALANNGVPVLFLHTWAAAYFPDDVQVAFAARMRELAATRDVYWLACEWPRGVAGLTLPAPRAPEPSKGASQIVVTEPGDVSRDWGWCHAHGRWLALSLPAGPKA